MIGNRIEVIYPRMTQMNTDEEERNSLKVNSLNS